MNTFQIRQLQPLLAAPDLNLDEAIYQVYAFNLV